ncbi:hypothetical protein KI387_024609, partial [Taxus chinensis]
GQIWDNNLVTHGDICLLDEETSGLEASIGHGVKNDGMTLILLIKFDSPTLTL